MRKFLLIALLLCTAIPSEAQFTSWGGQGYTYQDSRVFEVGFDPDAVQQSPVEINVVSVEVFNKEVIELKLPTTAYALFRLPAGSDRVSVLVKRDHVKAKYVATILNLIKNDLYVTFYRAEMRQGYSDVTYEINSRGAWKMRRENNFGSDIQIIGDHNPVVIFRNGFLPDRFPPGSPPMITSRWTQRIMHDRQLLLCLDEKKTGAISVPTEKK